MALGAVLAAALTDHSQRITAIYIDGVDVSKEPATPSRYAVPGNTISINELGPDGVSSMEFTIECTTALPITVLDGAEVRFEYTSLTPAYRYFRGWVDHVDYENMDGDVGTRFKVRCTGIEAALDWMVLPADTVIAAGTDPGVAVQMLLTASTGTVGGIFNAAGSGTGSGTSSQATPIITGWAPVYALASAVTVSAGTTLREGIRQITAQSPGSLGGIFATVDFWGGLRYFDGLTDNVVITVDDDPPVNGPGENTTYGIDASQVRQVVVKGTGVTATVSDGSGKPGATAVLVDATITTIAAAQQAGSGYLRQYASAIRGQWTYTDYDGGGNGIHAFQTFGGIADARLGLTGTNQQVSAIARSNFHGGGSSNNKEDDTFSFGGRPPSVTALTRQLTRTTLS
jgi:hypothetical protein